jgi:phosphoribosylformimino-5-aminoimidazole carboxamide ribotide isomerase
MRLIPVIDLLDARVVHAVRGERSHYKPVKSLLCDVPDPIAVARAFRDQLRLSEIYVADLNAIQGASLAGHRSLIERLAREEEIKIILDAGASDAESARNWLGLGINKAVIGSETLKSFDDLKNIPGFLDPDRLIFSLDMRSGKVLSLCPEIASMSVMELLAQLRSCGWREVLMLDLGRVGTGEGTIGSLSSEARAKFPDLKLLVGGGIAGFEELLELKAAGIVGVLLATALHTGAITAEQIWSAAANLPL